MLIKTLFPLISNYLSIQNQSHVIPLSSITHFKVKGARFLFSLTSKRVRGKVGEKLRSSLDLCGAVKGTKRKGGV